MAILEFKEYNNGHSGIKGAH